MFVRRLVYRRHVAAVSTAINVAGRAGRTSRSSSVARDLRLEGPPAADCDAEVRRAHLRGAAAHEGQRGVRWASQWEHQTGPTSGQVAILDGAFLAEGARGTGWHPQSAHGWGHLRAAVVARGDAVLLPDAVAPVEDAVVARACGLRPGVRAAGRRKLAGPLSRAARGHVAVLPGRTRAPAVAGFSRADRCVDRCVDLCVDLCDDNVLVAAPDTRDRTQHHGHDETRRAPHAGHSGPAHATVPTSGTHRPTIADGRTGHGSRTAVELLSM